MITLQAAAPATRARGPTAEALSRLLHHRSFLIGGALVLLIVFVAIFADLMAPFDPLRSNVRARLRPPDGTYWFGTDHFGRDILTRILYGARISLTIGAWTVVVTGIFGTLIGAASGFFRALDNPIMRLMDALMAFPSILLAITVSAVLGASVPNVIIALSIATGSPASTSGGSR